MVAKQILDAKVSLRSLSECIPFLVAIIGFKHKVAITTSVAKASTSSPEDVPHVVGKAVSSQCIFILRDHLVVIVGFLACAAYGNELKGLRNFCILGALILSFDIISVYTFFSAILALKVEINRARRTQDLQYVLEEDGISSLVAARVAERNATIEHPNETNFFKSNSSSIVYFKVIMSLGFSPSMHFGWVVHGYTILQMEVPVEVSHSLVMFHF